MSQQVEILKDEVIRNEIKAESDFVVLDDMPQEATPHKEVVKEVWAEEPQESERLTFATAEETNTMAVHDTKTDL